MGLNKEERKQLVNSLHNYVEEAYARHQDRREFLDYLIELYEKHGLDGLESTSRAAFLELIEEAL